jgi:hypothetical protein
MDTSKTCTVTEYPGADEAGLYERIRIAFAHADADRPARPQGTAPQRQTPTDTRPAAGVTIARTGSATSPSSNASYPPPPKPGAAQPTVPGPLELDRPGNVLGVIPILLIFEAVAGYALFAAWCWVAGGR